MTLFTVICCTKIRYFELYTYIKSNAVTSLMQNDALYCEFLVLEMFAFDGNTHIFLETLLIITLTKQESVALQMQYQNT